MTERWDGDSALPSDRRVCLGLEHMSSLSPLCFEFSMYCPPSSERSPSPLWPFSTFGPLEPMLPNRLPCAWRSSRSLLRIAAPEQPDLTLHPARNGHQAPLPSPGKQQPWIFTAFLATSTTRPVHVRAFAQRLTSMTTREAAGRWSVDRLAGAAAEAASPRRRSLLPLASAAGRLSRRLCRQRRVAAVVPAPFAVRLTSRALLAPAAEARPRTKPSGRPTATPPSPACPFIT
jgi:hypothetical protein